MNTSEIRLVRSDPKNIKVNGSLFFSVQRTRIKGIFFSFTIMHIVEMAFAPVQTAMTIFILKSYQSHMQHTIMLL